MEERPPFEPFVSIVIEPAVTLVCSSPQERNEPATARPHAIELDVEGSSVWVWFGADSAMMTTIVGTLKASK